MNQPVLKGLYLSNIDPVQSLGYFTKVYGQIKGFSHLGFNMDLIGFDYQGKITLNQVFEKNLPYSDKINILASSGKNLLVRRLHLLNHAFSHIKRTKPNFLYLRYPRSEPLYLYFLFKVRKHFPNLLILSEFPTFPYDNEYIDSVKLKDKIVFFLDKMTRQCLKKFINIAVAVNYDQPIFGIHTISIDNGIDISKYQLICHQNDRSKSILNLIGVANVGSRHGYDRILEGLGQYYNDHDLPECIVRFNIVGARDPYLKELLTMVEHLQIAKYVTFYEPCEGKKLDILFNSSDLAIGILGAHRKGLDIMTPLKNREYCARGIPFVLSHHDPDFARDFKYCLYLPPDDSPIDIHNLVSFYRTQPRSESLSKEMRLYAQHKLDWSSKLKPLKSYIIKHNMLSSKN